MVKGRRASKATTGSGQQSQALSARDQVVEMASNGDLQALVGAFASDLGQFVEHEEKAALIQRALEAHQNQGGAPAVIEAVLSAMIQFDAQFLFCCQARIAEATKTHAQHAGYLAGPPPDVVEHELTRLARIEDRLVSLAKSYATIQHTLSISTPQAVATGARRRICGRVVPLRPVNNAGHDAQEVASG